MSQHTRKSRAWSRRNFLRGAGGAALALPLLETFSGKRARGAEPTGPPKRLVIFFHPNGMVMDDWRCTVNPADASDFTLSPILAPLAPHKDDLLVLEGVDMNSSYAPQQQATAHEGGAAALLTGYWAGPGTMFGGGGLEAGYAISHSVDYHIGEFVGADVPFNSVHLGVKNTGQSLTTRISYAGKDLPINPNPDPWDLKSKIFGGNANGELAHREHVLNKVMADFQALNCQLGYEDKKRLDQHLTAVSAIEDKLDILAVASCTEPELGTSPGSTNQDVNIPAFGTAQMDLLVQALKCDMTRVATLQWVAPVVYTTYSWLQQTEVHHALTHKTDADSAAQMTQIYTWYAQQFAYLLAEMKKVVEPDGSTLLDNTVVLWCSEISRGWDHFRRDMPFVLAGGCQGYFQTGRYLKYTDAPSHNRLLLGLCDAMGLPDQTFGAPEFCTGGVLPGLSG